MSAVAAATELIALPAYGRVFSRQRQVRLGDVDQRGRLRLDAIARYLQDVATDDTADADLDAGGSATSWVVRRTTIHGASGASIEAVSLWIRIGATSGRPTRIGERFTELYGATAGDRQVSPRLQLPGPPHGVEQHAWPIRAVDLDPLRHVNKAVHWAIVEESLPPRSRRGRAEIEYLRPVAAGTDITLANKPALDDGEAVSSWLLDGDRVLTAARWSPAS